MIDFLFLVFFMYLYVPNFRKLGKVDDFKKQMPNIMDTFDSPYDYGSVMHYGPKTFSKNEMYILV